ncbi:ABC transporter permease [Rhodoligotrophos defluvii]|uniref:ABC transporter permease n=1 Tax=Rhodoligotrophos defluvii TaxID=2561934 RepID=UPI001961491B|nr:ABC transporter permease [Rhodoligotrophos defluvii]
MNTSARATRLQFMGNAALIAPLLLFLTVFYFYPIAAFLFRSVSTQEVTNVIPRTTAALRNWDGEDLPEPAAYAALVADLNSSSQGAAILGRRLNALAPGLRTAVRKATSAAQDHGAATPSEVKAALIAADGRWGEPETWQLIRRETGPVTGTFLLAAVDLERGEQGLHTRGGGESLFVPIFLRTLAISLAVTIICTAIGYPVAWVIAQAPPRTATWLMLLVLVPFWLSILARTAAWVIVLQGSGPINSFLVWTGLASAPVPLIFNRFGVILVMVHVMLPFVVLPVVNAIRAIPKSYFQAAANLGAPPASAFLRVILPLTLPGIWAGAFIVFILSIGYYITPALVGGPSDQMISSFIAFYTNQSVNWSLASALSAWLLGGMLVLVMVSQRFVGPMIKRAT